MKKALGFITCLIALAFGVHAQRTVNFRGFIASPDTSRITTINCVDSYLVKTGFINMGPDVLYPTDTVAFIDPFVESDYVWLTSPDDTMKVGDTLIAENYYFHASEFQNLLDTTGELVAGPFDAGNYYFFSEFLGFGGESRSTDVVYDDSTYFLSAAAITLNCSTAIHNVNANRTTLKVYPNPASDQVFISSSFTAPTNASVQITDVAGRIVKTVNMGPQSPGSRNFTVDVSNLTNGLYYIELITNDARSINKFIKN